VKNIRLKAVAAAAALIATSGFALTSPQASAQTKAQITGAQTTGTHSVNWGDVTIPGQLCRVNGPIHLHNGQAKVSHSGFGMALDVSLFTITRGDLESHGLQVAALQIWCNNTGGTADGELAEGIMVFASSKSPHLLGTLTPQHHTSAMVHIPFIIVNRIDTTGHIAVTEHFYNNIDPTCCPSGTATTLWKWTGRTFIPGRTKITSK
jgi:hypothetical protein